MAVTGIQTITNLTKRSIRFLNTESSGNNRVVDPQWTMDVGNAWVPWARSEKEFLGHHMEISGEDGKPFAYLWQHDVDGEDFVRISSSGYEDKGDPLIKVGIKCNLTVLEDGGVEATYV